MASEEPAVAVPITFPSLGAFQRSATIDSFCEISQIQELIKKVERTHRYAAVVNDGRSRVFIQIDNVFIEIFHDKFISIRWHPCMNETCHMWVLTFEEKLDYHDSRCEIQQRIAVKSTFVMKELICRS